MNELIKALKEIKKKYDDDLFEFIVNYFEKNITYYINKVKEVIKDDLKQDLLYSIYKAINTFEININTKTNIDILDKNKYFKKYVYENSDLKQDDIIQELNLYNNQNQFIDYILKRLYSTYIDFSKCKYCKDFSNTISLNSVNNEGEELINKIFDNNFYKEQTKFDLMDLSKKELMFLNYFIENGIQLSEQEVAKKLGISQQAVNKKKKQIIKKYEYKL